jgi:hypothetical protein
MTTEWSPAPQNPRPGLADRWVVCQGDQVLGTFDHAKEAKAFAKRIPDARIERRSNVLALGSGGLRDGRIGF